jgi:hypothetical protein
MTNHAADIALLATEIANLAGRIHLLAAQLVPPPPPPPAQPRWADWRETLPHNASPDDPWLLARKRTDWWVRTPAQIKRITLHHYASNATAPQVAAYITRPLAQGGKGLPRTQYHFEIDHDGALSYTLDTKFGCWHDSGGDQNTGISVAFRGALHNRKPPIAQLAGAVLLVDWLMTEYGIPLTHVDGHDEWARKFVGAGTQCPGWTPGGWRSEFFNLLIEMRTADLRAVPRLDGAFAYSAPAVSAPLTGGAVDPAEIEALARGGDDVVTGTA